MSEHEQVGAQMPRYRCHKEVWALKIAGVETALNGDKRFQFVETGYAPIQVAPFERFAAAKSGDYLVVYDDGYQSISPAKAFEDGYTRI